jgi:transposase InsO family protein
MGRLLKGQHPKLNSLLRKLYYDPKSKTAFSSPRQLYQKAKLTLKSIKYKDVIDWLQGERTYTLHKPIRKKFRRRKTVVGGIDYQWQADLADMQKMSKQNNDNRYLLCVIDVFSKYAWVVPIQNKMGKTLINAFQSILKKSKRKPLSLQTDKGSEFKNREFQQFLKKNQIHFFTTDNPETKASIVERFQRTLKTRMWKYFTYNKTRRYIDVLKHLVNNYNTTFHRSIQTSPDLVKTSNEAKISEILYSPKKEKLTPKLKLKDKVRINKTKHMFDKGYLPNWTQEIFEITHVNKTSPITYKLKDLNNEHIMGTFYDHELQLIKDNEIYEIDSVLDQRRRREGKRFINEIKVNWKGYPKKFQSWIPESYLV